VGVDDPGYSVTLTAGNLERRMADRLLLVDLENIQTMDLSRVAGDVRVMVFYGITQKKLPEELVVQAQPVGTRLQWIKIAGQGPNALDFHIAYYLGQELTRDPSTECVILSRDTGFDPLVRHLQSLKRDCRRVAAAKDAFPVAHPAATAAAAHTGDHYVRLLTLLKKEKALPARRKGLAGKIRSWFGKLSEAERDELLQRLYRESKVRDAGTAVAYQL
jgi:hypothetical protein